MKTRKFVGLQPVWVVVAVFPVWTSGVRADFTFETIADETTTVPGETFPFNAFNIAAVSGERVAFVGKRVNSTASFRVGIFLHQPGGLVALVKNGDLIPGETFFSFSSILGDFSMDGGAVAFKAYSNTTTIDGLYLAAAGGIETVADRRMTIPGTSQNFTLFSRPAFVDHRVAFSGSRGIGTGGVYHKVDESLVPLVQAGDPVPGGGATYLNLSQLNISGSDARFSFWASNTGGVTALYTNTGAGGGIESRLEWSSALPGGGGVFNSVQQATMDGDNIAFLGGEDWGSGADPRYTSGIYSSASGALTQVAGFDTPIPDGTGDFTGFNYANLSGNTVVASGTGSGGQSVIFRVTGSGPLERVVGVGDEVLGRTVNSVMIGPESYKGAGIAVTLGFSDGGAGVYLATSEPPPPQTYAEWAAAVFPAEMLGTPDAAPDGDADFDGVENAFEQLAGGNPLDPADRDMVAPQFEVTTGECTVTYQIVKPAPALEASFETATDLREESWQPTEPSATLVLDDQPEYTRYQTTIPMPGGAHGFGRMKLVEP